MSRSTPQASKCRSTFFLANITIGLVISAVALYMVITGEYSNLAERKDMEGMLNTITLLGMFYALGSWYGYVFFSPRCKTEEPTSELL